MKNPQTNSRSGTGDVGTLNEMERGSGKPRIEAGDEVAGVRRNAEICAIVVTYFPDSRFRERLECIRRQVGKTVVVDNTDSGSNSEVSQLAGVSGIEIIRNRENVGIGFALNAGLELAAEQGYKWAITFDQDTWAKENLSESLLNILQSQTRAERVGVIGCNYEDENLAISPVAYKKDGPRFSETETVITSGCLMSLEAYSAVGPFRSEFFIDYIDHEYCLRLKKFGYKVLIANEPLMIHALGAATALNIGNGGGKVALVLTNRPPLRRYYMTRNGLLVAKEYWGLKPMWALKTVASLLGYAPLKIALESTGRWKKLRATARGAVDAFRGKTGKAEMKWLKE